MPVSSPQPTGRNWSDPAESAAAVTPSDSTVLSPVPRSLYIGGDGDVAVILARDSAVTTFVGLTAGTILPVRVTKVMAANTTATNIIALH